MKYCPNCGTKIEDRNASCPKCGFKTFEYILKAKSDGDSKTKVTQVVQAEDESQEAMPWEENQTAMPAVKANHEKYDYYENRSYDTYNYSSYDHINSEESVDTTEEPSLAAKILLIVVVIFLNIIGAVIGLVFGGVYMNKKGRGYRSFGKKLVITSAVFLVLDILIWWAIFIALRNFM